MSVAQPNDGFQRPEKPGPIAVRQNRETASVQNVAHYLTEAVPTARPSESAGEVRNRLAGDQYDDASFVFVVTEQHRLTGIVPIGDLIGASATMHLSELIKETDSQTVTLATDREAAASQALNAGVSVLGVCDDGNRFVGALSASALISILRDEHLEDIHHMAGILGRSETAKAALMSPPHRRAFYRLPWLIVGMAGSALATATMMRFEAVLTANIAVAFFIPAIVYLADAVGTQSEAVAVRGLSLGSTSNLAPLLAGEIGTGVLIGAALGSIAYPMVWLAFGSPALAATVAMALVVASSVATTIGILLPWLFAKLGYDPALGSGPVGTVVQDVLSLMIYFWIAAALVF